MLRKLWRIFALVMALVLSSCCAAQAEAAEDYAAGDYAIDVDITNQIVTIYHASDRDISGVVRQMICSTGSGEIPEDATPIGEFELNQRYDHERTEWYEIPKYHCFVQYVTRIVDAYLFHSLPYAEKDISTLDQQAVAQMGEPVSHGCIRLWPEDAKWIAENCPNGTDVRIYYSGERNELLRSLLLRESFSIDGKYFDYADFIASAGGLTAAVEAEQIRRSIGY